MENVSSQPVAPVQRRYPLWRIPIWLVAAVVFMFVSLNIPVAKKHPPTSETECGRFDGGFPFTIISHDTQVAFGIPTAYAQVHPDLNSNSNGLSLGLDRCTWVSEFSWINALWNVILYFALFAFIDITAFHRKKHLMYVLGVVGLLVLYGIGSLLP